jgi:hypothetical protein
MIKKVKEIDAYEVSCDKCSTGYEEVEAEDWHDALRQIKEMGWKNNKINGEWRQVCPDCQ